MRRGRSGSGRSPGAGGTKRTRHDSDDDGAGDKRMKTGPKSGEGAAGGKRPSSKGGGEKKGDKKKKKKRSRSSSSSSSSSS